ncbi:homocysteine S-methyltransferase YbgG-like [Ornithodoros turicata]|uniref:homocysteine S-methyltransferase YbgG-like n=1 Tax=Ornithodoros turicata TaxID=34597 RepID=UPI00313A15E4
MAHQTVRVLDGSAGSELKKLGFVRAKDPLWSARCLVSNPRAVIDLHKRYIESGSDVISTISYQAGITNLQQHLKISSAEAERIIASSYEIACTARQECQRPNVVIAGSIGPYGAALADCSEYTGAYADHITTEELMAWHKPRLQCLHRVGCNLFAFETIPALLEGLALTRLLREFPNAKAWLSFSCQDGEHTVKGELFSDVVQKCLQEDVGRQLVAIGVNCCPPETVSRLLKTTGRLTVPYVVYPNSGETYTPEGWVGKQDLKPLSSYVNEWIELNALFIGGCCRTGPKDIEGIVNVVRLRNDCSA